MKLRLVRLLFRVKIDDTQCGAKLFRAAATPVGFFDAPFLTRWLFDVEVIALGWDWSWLMWK